MKMRIIPVILAGGSGTRLWPLSRESYPKQFSKIIGERSLFQQTVTRFKGEGFDAPIIITTDPYRFIVMEQLAALEQTAQAILIEPSRRNTAASIAAVVQKVLTENQDTALMITASDHIIEDGEGFRNAVLSAQDAVQADFIVTFGIKPTRAETGYGYLELASHEASFSRVPQALKSFKEKPSLENARHMFEAGNYLWNASIFFATSKTFADAYKKHAPEVFAGVKEAVSLSKNDLAFTRLAKEPWDKISDISVDYAIMEKVDNLVVMPYGGSWSDFGSWQAVWEHMENDKHANACSQNAYAVDCKATLLRSENSKQALVGIGLDNMIAVSMPDAVLVIDKSKSQRTKEAVSILKKHGHSQALNFPIDHRPWGNFESIAKGDRFQVKRIVVKLGASLSLQSHHHRAEHWIVVEGTAKITVDKKITILSENQSIYVPLGAIHRLENPGLVDVVLIEVQTGAYLGEDDIIRYEDIYARD